MGVQRQCDGRAGKDPQRFIPTTPAPSGKVSVWVSQLPVKVSLQPKSATKHRGSHGLYSQGYFPWPDPKSHVLGQKHPKMGAFTFLKSIKETRGEASDGPGIPRISGLSTVPFSCWEGLSLQRRQATVRSSACDQ